MTAATPFTPVEQLGTTSITLWTLRNHNWGDIGDPSRSPAMGTARSEWRHKGKRDMMEEITVRLEVFLQTTSVPNNLPNQGVK
jgi:hypothetical protein